MIRHRRPLGWDRLEDRVCQAAGHHTPSLELAGGKPPGAWSPVGSVIGGGQYVTFYQQEISEFYAEASSRRWNVVFFGDSVGYNFSYGDGEAVWNTRIAPLGAVNFSIIGNTLENLNYQVTAGGELARSPKVAVIEVGINDLAYGQSVDQVVSETVDVVRSIRKVSPRTKVLLLGLFTPDPTGTWLRSDVSQINERLSGLDNGGSVRFADPGSAYEAPDGSVAADTSDGFHPNAAGFGVVADVIVPVLDQMLGKSPVADAQAARK